MKTGMIPNIYLQEQLVRDLIRPGQRQAEQERILGYGRLQHLVGCLGTFFVTLGIHRQQLEHVIDRSLAMGREVKVLWRKDVTMHQPIQAEELITQTHLETDASERGKLVQCGFTTEEIMALFWLRRWYQTGGSDRMELVCHWRFLKLLVITGRLEV
jgi:hypothetical protein